MRGPVLMTKRSGRSSVLRESMYLVASGVPARKLRITLRLCATRDACLSLHSDAISRQIAKSLICIEQCRR